MDTRIANLTIEGSRGFRELKLAGLGRVNLITSRNNTGKSSFYGFPELSGSWEPIVVAASGNQQPMNLTLALG